MSEITRSELEGIRDAQADFMPSLGTIKRREFLGDGEYGYYSIADNVPSRLTAGFGQWRSVADRYQGLTAFTLTVPWDQDIQAGDVFVDAEAKVYEIRDVKAPNTYQTAKQCLTDLQSEG